MPDYQGKVGLAQSLSDVTSIAESAITLIKPSTSEELTQQMPVPNAGDHILFVECWDDPNCATPGSDPSYPPLWPRGKLADLVGADVPRPRDESEPEHHQLQRSRRRARPARGTAPSSRRSTTPIGLSSASWSSTPTYPASGVLKDFLGRGPTLFDLRSKKIVVFAYNSPYHLDAGELRNVDLFVAAYSKIEPSLRASLKVLFQDPTILRNGGAASCPSTTSMRATWSTTSAKASRPTRRSRSR